MCRHSNNTGRAILHGSIGGIDRSAGGIDHIINYDDFLGFQIANKMSYLSLIRSRPALVHEAKADAKVLRKRLCHRCAASIRSENHGSFTGEAKLPQFFKNDLTGIEMIERYVRKTLNLRRVKVHSKYTTHPHTAD